MHITAAASFFSILTVLSFPTYRTRAHEVRQALENRPGAPAPTDCIFIWKRTLKMMNAAEACFEQKQKTGHAINNNENKALLHIDHLEQMSPFFMTLISDSEIWAFISSTGSLSAGRGHAENSFFPYHTVDKIHDSYGIAGPFTLIRLPNGTLWEPFDSKTGAEGQCRRYLSRNVTGTVLRFTEERLDLGLKFSYSWQASSTFGLTRKSRISNFGNKPVRFSLIDGLMGITPPGISIKLQAQSSCLTDAYKKNELIPNSRLGIYALSAGIIDEPVPMESLTANCVWSEGLPDARVFLSDSAVVFFREESPMIQRNETRGERGAYLLQSDIQINPKETIYWTITINGPVGGADLSDLNAQLTFNPDQVSAHLEKHLHAGQLRLKHLLSNCDAFQKTNNDIVDAHHCANVIYNIMRGGTPVQNYDISAEDFIAFVGRSSKKTAIRHAALLNRLKGTLDYNEVDQRIMAANDPVLHRLWTEYLPFIFSRRHGDPSRPWNTFHIQLQNPNGDPRFAYQGNWRDIFQNWEALSMSFPRFLSHITSKFLNASTMDGYNPYRISSNGLDWEEPNPDDPWSGTGYWGDHQIVYLTRLLEHQEAFFPTSLKNILADEMYVYADVPYEIVSAEQLLKNPRETILFKKEKSQSLRENQRTAGSDAVLRIGIDGLPFRVSLAEKLLVPVLTKLTNFIPGGGIWMNTQRPEWNDANNALVGYGLSMVTVCQLRRHLAFLEDLFRSGGSNSVTISTPVKELFLNVHGILSLYSGEIHEAGSIPEKRAEVALKLIRGGSSYRNKIYAKPVFPKDTVQLSNIADFFALAIRWMDSSIRCSRRTDGLYQSYNILQYDEHYNRFETHHLYEMLEGQVAVLSTGLLNATESLNLLDALRSSRMYRSDLKTYILYPDRQLPAFLEKGIIPAQQVDQSPLLTALITCPYNPLTTFDHDGTVRFHPELSTVERVKEALDRLSVDEKLTVLVEKEYSWIVQLYQEVFKHTEFTGRSGTMFGYEGLGCTYWHMVSKLLLAVQETCIQHRDQPEFKTLVEHYYKIRQGLGFNKTPKEYGAFPTEPYSHTPARGGARQPGMTGQVKEEILTRFGELGIRIHKGTIQFRPELLRRSEFLTHTASFEFFDTHGHRQTFEIQPEELAFTFCQVPIIYQLGETSGKIIITDNQKVEHTMYSGILPKDWSNSLFARDQKISRIRVFLAPQDLIDLNDG